MSAHPNPAHHRFHTIELYRSRPRAVRNRLPDERMSVTHKFNVGGHEGYITVGLYPDRQPGEVFITMAKEGSTVSGLISSFAQALSIALQHGVPLELFCDKFSYTRFEPSGWTGNPEIHHATSVMDYIFRWLQLRFIGGTKNAAAPTQTASIKNTQMPACLGSKGRMVFSVRRVQRRDASRAAALRGYRAPVARSFAGRNGRVAICLFRPDTLSQSPSLRKL